MDLCRNLIMKDFDPADFRSPAAADLDVLPPRPSKKPPRHRQGEQFLKGPIPWPWLLRAMTLRGRALHVALLVWKESGIRRDRTVHLNISATAKIGIHPDTARRGLQALASAKLVAVTHHPGQALEVTLLETPAENIDP
jgi:hypothetical protein